jgi:hypothetical protein
MEELGLKVEERDLIFVLSSFNHVFEAVSKAADINSTTISEGLRLSLEQMLSRHNAMVTGVRVYLVDRAEGDS